MNLHSPHGSLSRWVRWTGAHRRVVIMGWVAAVLIAMFAAHSAGSRHVDNLSLPGTDSQRVANVLQRQFASQAGDADQIVFHVRGATVADPAIRAAVAEALARVDRLPHVRGVVSPYAPQGARDVSADRRTAFAVVTFDESATTLPVKAIDRAISVARSVQSPKLQVEPAGRAIEQTTRPSLGAATSIGLVAAIAVLLVTFGSALAAGLPIITALLGLGTALGLIGLGSHLLDTPDFASQLAALLGLGVGVDYALFIVTRFREDYRRTGDLARAVDGAMDTAGRAVLFAGATVVIALLELFILGITLLEAAALSAVVTVGLVLAAALTVLPGLLGRFGPRIAAERLRGRAPRASAFWPRWAAAVTRHPWRALTAGLLVMTVLSIPAFSLRLGQSDAGNDPASQTTRQANDLPARGFGSGFNGPLQVVAQLPRPRDHAATATIAAALRGTPGVASVSPAKLSPTGTTAVFQAIPTGRVVNVTSEIYSRKLALENLQGERKYSYFGAYRISKLGNVLFSRELARRLEGSGVTVVSVSPGPARTNFGGGGPSGLMGVLTGVMERTPVFKSAEEAAKGIVWAATAPGITSGGLYMRGKQLKFRGAATDPASAMKVWSISEEQTGIDPARSAVAAVSTANRAA